MGTNFYRIPTESQIKEKKEILIDRINYLNLSPENIETGFRTISLSKDWEWISPWEEFIQGTNVHLGKRSHGWKFCWNFHNDKYYSNKEELIDFINDGRVIDEYGELIDNNEFIEMAMSWGQPDGLVVNEEYRKKERTKGHGSFWLDNEKYDDIIIDGLRVSKSTDFC